MAGGVGSRLWPVSRESCPKQFIKIFNNKSLLQLTLERNKIFGRPLVIITKEHYNLAKEQAEELGIELDFIIEPVGRNTAPCAVSASLASGDADEVIALLPSDHHIENTDCYIEAIYRSAAAAVAGGVITFGVTPTNLHTGYGYIKALPHAQSGILKVFEFIEKPSLKEACQYTVDKDYYWNSGIFVFKPEVMLSLAFDIDPKMHQGVLQAFKNAMQEDGAVFLHQSYDNIAPNSIDFAFMERAQNLQMIKADFDWHDLGGWKSLWDIYDKDSVGNTTLGDVELYDTSNSYIHSDGRLTAVVGVNDIIVINTPDASLIVHKSRVEDVKHLVQNLVTKNRAEVRRSVVK